MIRAWFASATRSPRSKLIAIGAALAIVAIGIASFLLAGASRGCSSREDVTARVSLVSSELQQAAAQGKIKVEQLAGGIRRMNAAANTYNTTQDHQAYCDALDEIGEEF